MSCAGWVGDDADPEQVEESSLGTFHTNAIAKGFAVRVSGLSFFLDTYLVADFVARVAASA